MIRVELSGSGYIVHVLGNLNPALREPLRQLLANCRRAGSAVTLDVDPTVAADPACAELLEWARGAGIVVPAGLPRPRPGHRPGGTPPPREASERDHPRNGTTRR